MTQIKMFLAFCVGWAFCYLMFAFAHAEIDFQQWSTFSRGSCALIGSVFGAVFSAAFSVFD